MKSILIFCLLVSINLYSQNSFQVDSIKTSKGSLKIIFIAHASLIFEFNGKVIYVDPVCKFADYKKLPKADIILITHQHFDHLDSNAVNDIKGEKTKIFCNQLSLKTLTNAAVLRNGDKANVDGMKIETVPAYNLLHKNDAGELFHPKGVGNGYVLYFGNKKIYIVGDTENIPEMKKLKNIDIAFLPMNLPYTMTPEMVADAVNLFHPKILYPYHTGNTDINELLRLMKDNKSCEVRIRSMK